MPKIIRAKVKPGSRSSCIAQLDDGTWLVQLKALPVDGKANRELIEVIASHFACRKSAVSIKSGASSRMKLIRIDVA